MHASRSMFDLLISLDMVLFLLPMLVSRFATSQCSIIKYNISNVQSLVDVNIHIIMVSISIRVFRFSVSRITMSQPSTIKYILFIVECPLDMIIHIIPGFHKLQLINLASNFTCRCFAIIEWTLGVSIGHPASSWNLARLSYTLTYTAAYFYGTF